MHEENQEGQRRVAVAAVVTAWLLRNLTTAVDQKVKAGGGALFLARMAEEERPSAGTEVAQLIHGQYRLK
jgi:hypothetical protein